MSLSARLKGILTVNNQISTFMTIAQGLSESPEMTVARSLDRLARTTSWSAGNQGRGRPSVKRKKKAKTHGKNKRNRK